MAKPWEKRKKTDKPWETRKAKTTPTKPAIDPPGLGAFDYIGGAAGDLTLQGITGLPAMVAGGVRGLYSMATGEQDYGDKVQETMGALTYQPRSPGGKAITSLADIPMQKYAELTNEAGGKITDWSGSPALGAGAKTALDIVPMVAGGLIGRRTPPKAAKPKIEPTMRTDEPLSGEPTLHTEPTLAPETEPSLTPRRPETATDRARAMAEQAGIDWNALSGTMKSKVAELAKNATAFEAVDKASLGRIMRGESLPVPVTKMTKGQATRDSGQLRSEDALAVTDAGLPIREAQIKQNEALIANLDEMERRTGSRAKVSEQAGAAVAEGGLAKARNESKRDYQQLYKEADASAEGAMPVDPQPLVDWVIANESNATVAGSINTIRADLAKMGIVRYEPDGEVVKQRKMTMREAEMLRQKTHDLWDIHQNGLFMGRLRRVIDNMTESGGGDLYRQARAARSRHAMEFEEPEAIAQLLTDKSRTDKKIALEDVWHKSVLSRSVADVRLLKETLFKSKDKRVRAGGRKAWREIAGETIRYIREQATKGVATDAAGNMNLSPAGLKRALDKIGDQKLEIILGKTQAKQLRDLQIVAIDTKTIPPYKGGSSTAPNLLAVFDKLSKFPVLGPVTRGLVREGVELYKKGKEPAAVRAAMAGPDLRATPTKKKKKAKLSTKAPPPRISPMIPLSALAIPTSDQERQLAPFYSQKLTIDRARTGSIGRER